ncbi:hypothetical protein EVAR_19483_1 [Eumeta japonica]|uniref:Uncharacterized protein n=1 Tax=Eumeta variegata TaxID=151549 RepID=A0A4C1VA29_EUMVA|nr:hypothetical protein EVAR_19483_1 [Eumeta japonica]
MHGMLGVKENKPAVGTVRLSWLKKNVVRSTVARRSITCTRKHTLKHRHRTPLHIERSRDRTAISINLLRCSGSDKRPLSVAPHAHAWLANSALSLKQSSRV